MTLNNKAHTPVSCHFMFEYRYLEALDLSSNNIQNVEARTFRRMEKLSTVDLSYNLIEDIPESLFHRRSALLTLRWVYVSCQGKLV